MIRKYAKLLVLISIITLLPVLAGLLLWDQLPEQLPFHWNASWEVDGWCSKSFGVFGTPLILAAIPWLTVLITAADPKKAGHSEKMMQVLFWFFPVLSVMLHTVIYMTALGKEIRVDLLVPVLLGLLFAICGNYLPKCKQSYTVGLKLPWTLHSEENWNRTHRFAGPVWVVGGLVMMLSGFLGENRIMIAAALVMVLAPAAYSYLLYCKGV